MAKEEALRCLQCKNKPCVVGCPVYVKIPEFIQLIAEGKFEEAYDKIKETNSLPAVCGRVCPQESQCEKFCVRAKKGESVGIGRLERFAADWYMANREMKVEKAQRNGRKVAVVGGGNVAMDAARSAKRLGAEKVYIIYRRSEAEMPARIEEVHHAKEEGIVFKLLTNPTQVLGIEDGWVKGIECVEMELGEADSSGRRRPVVKQGSEHIIDVETVIIAIGQSPNPLIVSTTPGLNTQKWGGIITDEETGATSKEGVYAGGDAVTGAATVILAMGAGKKAAEAIDMYLKSRLTEFEMIGR